MALPWCPLVTSYHRPVPGMCDPAVTRRQLPHTLATHTYKDEPSFVPGIGNRCFSGPKEPHVPEDNPLQAVRVAQPDSSLSPGS